MNNYLEIEINEKKYGAKLGLRFVEIVTKGEGITDGNIFNVTLPRLMFYALQYGAERAGKTLDITLDDVFDLADEIGVKSEPFLLFQKVMFDSMLVNIDDPSVKKTIIDASKEIEGKLKTLSSKKK